MIHEETNASDSRSTRQERRRVLVRWSILFVAGYLLICGMFHFLQRKLIYHPQRQELPAASFDATRQRIHDVTTQTEDGITLHGWLVLAEPANDAVQSVQASQRFLVLHFPGNAANRERRLPSAELWNEAGCDMLIFDYRGYAENAGSPSENGLSLDAHAAWTFATETLRVPDSRIVVCGESLGGGVACGLVHDRCQNGNQPAGLMLRSTFTSLADAGKHHYPWLPVGWMLQDRYPSIERISEIDCPLLIVHGNSDTIVPFEHGQRLFEAAPASANGIAKQFVELHDTGHNDIMYVSRDKLFSAQAAFVRRLSQD